MKNGNTEQKYEIGMIGLGVMGRNLLFNMADNGFSVAGYDKDMSKVKTLSDEAGNKNVFSTGDIKDFVGRLKRPRAVMMLVPAGAPVDSVIHDLLDHLQQGDLIIDAGNSYFKDTDLRSAKLAEKKILYMGVGVSGGEEGARHGPSIMPGGPVESWERVQPVFSAIAASVKGQPCVTHIGPGSAGHFVKMVHNGIEYAIMQLIAETYDLMKRGLGFNDEELHDIYFDWNNGSLNSYLIEITADIFSKTDDQTGKKLIDEILDVARQKGTGMWTSQSAMELQVPIPTIDMAVMMRDLSVYEDQRQTASGLFQIGKNQFSGDRRAFLQHLRNGLLASFILTFAQGMAVLYSASERYNYHLDPGSIARIWRGGCIIRAEILEDIMEAYLKRPNLPNLLLDDKFSEVVIKNQDSVRVVVRQALEAGIPVPAFMASLSYFDAYRSAWLPANLIQAQRDYFGAHTYERIDTKGTFHSDWIKK